MASASVLPQKEKYDVFLSFRGEDTRKTFTSHLHAALIRRKVETYIDYRLERGDEVGPSLRKAIHESKISVIIFSKDYASSTWCLDELVHILECKETHGRYVIPIFYEIDPSHVRKQTGSYATAFSGHEGRLKGKSDKVAKWKEALVKAANLSGFDSSAKTVRDDSDLIEQVVRDVFAKLNRESSSDLTGLVGVEGRIKKILLELDIIPEDVRVSSLVIWGMGGIGKTTLEDAVFHGLSSQFEAHCFLANVRERSGLKGANISPQLFLLRDELLKQLLGDENFTNHARTIDVLVKERLRRTKVLVVLDDVDDSSQLEFLAGEVPFGLGSRIIITTRDLQPVNETLLLNNAAGLDVKIQKMEELNSVESLELFHSNASIHSENSEFLEKLMDHAAGIPLALKILQPLFLRCKTKEEVELLWDKLKKFPNRKLQNVYRASFDGLEQNEREIFLDVACLHKREKLCDAKRMLASCGLFPDDGIEILINMSLISIKNNCIWMHDVIQEMGWEIVRDECPDEPGERSRLHNSEDVCHVLNKNTGTSKVKSISCLDCVYGTLTLHPQAFTGMRKLRFLKIEILFKETFKTIIGLDQRKMEIHARAEYLPDALRYLHWRFYSLESMPSKFSPDNLVELHMPWSRLKSLWNKGQSPRNLKIIDLSNSLSLAEVGDLSNSVNIESINFQSCSRLAQVPDLSKSVNIKSINLHRCARLLQVPPYFQNLSKLTYLNLGYCSRVSVLPKMPNKLEFLDLSGTAFEELHPSVWSLRKLLELNLQSCRSIKNFSSRPWEMKSLNHINLSRTKIDLVPSSSFLCMTEIISFDLSHCDRLVTLPTDICKMKSLERLDLSYCSSFTNFPEIEEPMENLQYLNLRETKIEELPSSVGNLVGLRTLNLAFCKRLESLPNSLYKLKFVEEFSLCGCAKLRELPLSFSLSSLIELDLGYCELVEEIPDCYRSFPSLQVLKLSRTMIETIPPSIEQLSRLKRLSLFGCMRLQSLPALPCLLEYLDASLCTNLKAVSVSSVTTAQTEGILNQELSGRKRTESLTFHRCVNLNETAWINVMDDAHLRIMRIATACNLKRSAFGEVELLCPGNEVPKWFKCQAEGSSIHVKLPLNWYDDSNFLGIALCSVSSMDRNLSDCLIGYKCEMILKTNSDESESLDLGITGRSSFGDTDLVGVWYDKLHAISDESKLSTEASFNFYTDLRGKRLANVTRCGVCFLYGQGQDDHGALKFEVYDLPQQVTTIRKRLGRFEDEASGSQIHMSGHFDRGSETGGAGEYYSGRESRFGNLNQGFPNLYLLALTAIFSCIMYWIFMAY